MFNLISVLLVVLTGITVVPAVSEDLHPFVEHMRFMEGEWLTRNPTYEEGNGQPPRYGMRWSPGLSGASLTGVLWGDFGNDSTVMYWQFYSVWDPVRETALLYQESPWGALGVGEQTLQEDGASVELTFVNPDGSRWRVRDSEIRLTDDSIATYGSRLMEDGTWSEPQPYMWERVR